jgi:tetratricopeptide (TPR) repeat protein
MDGTRGGLAWVVASPLFAGVGLLSKESALLLPLLLFVTEWTLLGFGGLNDRGRRNLRLAVLGIAALPVAVATIYLLTNPGLLSYATRPFTMGERVLTEARVLWLYTQMLIAPDISVMGLFHDDVVVSRSLLEPWTTLPAVASLLFAVIGALAVRKRLPLLSFAVLFFLVGHSMESSVIGLELIYEHRNYLPVVAPLFAIAYVPTASRLAGEHRRALVMLTGMTLVLFASATALRAHQWSGLGRLVTAEVEHHPDSPRANFQYAQVVMTGLDDPKLREDAYALARHHFRRAVDLDPSNVDGLFGLVVLDLHVGRVPDAALVDELATRLKRVQFGPLTVSIAQFSFLVEWNLTAEPKLPRQHMLAILEAALQNPTNVGMARAAVYNALRAYHHRVLGELEPGLRYAELAVRTDPSNWTYRDRLVRLLAEARRFDDASAALDAAMASDRHELHAKDARELGRLIEVARRAGAGTTPTESP